MMKVKEKIKKVISILEESEDINLKVVEYYDDLNDTYNIYHNRENDSFTDEENSFIDNLLYDELDSNGIINYSFGFLYDFYDFKYDFDGVEVKEEELSFTVSENQSLKFQKRKVLSLTPNNKVDIDRSTSHTLADGFSNNTFQKIKKESNKYIKDLGHFKKVSNHMYNHFESIDQRVIA